MVLLHQTEIDEEGDGRRAINKIMKLPGLMSRWM